MLRRMPAETFIEWMCYAQLEPFDEVRADYRSAQIVQTLLNLHRNPQRSPYKLSDVILKFGSWPSEPRKTQTWQEQKAIAQMIVARYQAA